ncbi:MAG: glutaminase A [Planctomycetota bacterium]
MTTALRDLGAPAEIDAIDPLAHPLQAYIDELHERHLACREGQVADYIAQLGRADADWFGIAIATADGHVYLTGDADVPFSIQSISKPFVYGLALEDHGLDEVSRYVGVEPSGEAFNSISLDPVTGRPSNPMINAGAIASAGLVEADNPTDRINRILDMFARFVGHDVAIDGDVYRSESDTGFRNRAIANLLRNFEILQGDPDEVLDVYFQQCAILTSCRDLAVMGATLAAGGVCPITSERAISERTVRHMLSLMATCGMYDYAGEWVFRVGMPAKSGVAGGVLGVLPGQLGVAVFSPPLDAKGNSVRGIRVFNDLAAMLGLHMFHRTDPSHTFIRNRYSGKNVRSRRQRNSVQTQTLDRLGEKVGVWELQGYLPVYGAELVIRDVLANSRDMTHVVFDLRRITGVQQSSAMMLARFAVDATEHGRAVVFAHAEPHAAMTQAIDAAFGSLPQRPARVCADTDAAIEWCEDRLLDESLCQRPVSLASIEQFDLLNALTAEELDVMRHLLEERYAAPGEYLMRQGDEPDGVYFLVSGTASVLLEGDRPIRVATCSPVITVGEMSLLERRPRSATVRADDPMHYLVLTLDSFDRLRAEHTEIALKVMENVGRDLSTKLRQANTQIEALSD